jgi:hypothetical protein
VAGEVTVLHQPIPPRAPSPIDEIEDPDVRQAVEDLREVGAELRQRSADYAQLPENSRHRPPALSRINELTSRIAVRADRLGMSTNGLLALVNDDINHRARRGRPAPSRVTSRTVLDDLTAAEAREQDAHRALTAAQIELRAATIARIAAAERASAYAAGRQAVTA